MLEAMRSGRLVRFDEITRCPPEVQDALISTLSEKSMDHEVLAPDILRSCFCD
jgi:MoxR-like ATPase